MVADKHHRVNAEAPIVFLSPDVEKFSSLHRYAKSAIHLALAPALVTRVEPMGITVFYEKDSFHGAGEGANGNSDKLKALDFSVRVDCD
jgi:hypothetical protein